MKEKMREAYIFTLMIFGGMSCQLPFLGTTGQGTKVFCWLGSADAKHFWMVVKHS